MGMKRRKIQTVSPHPLSLPENIRVMREKTEQRKYRKQGMMERGRKVVGRDYLREREKRERESLCCPVC